MPRGARERIEVGRALFAYRSSVMPTVRAQLRRWERAAEKIPDPSLRADALSALRLKGLNAEATAVFGILAPRIRRQSAVRGMAALQVAVDYLDTLGERVASDPLRNGLQLHRALVDALSPGAPVSDWYRLSPVADDGGYLSALVTACRDEVATLPAATAVLPIARRAAERCGEGQSYTHAAELGNSEALRAWALDRRRDPRYTWWEIAAGASSSVAIHALIAAAADRRTTAREAALIDAAYCPSIGALTVLLDALIDRDEDIAGGAHNYTKYYRDEQEAADCFAFLATRSRSAVDQLPKPGRHAAILTGVAGFYLSDPGADAPYARPIATAMLATIGPAVDGVVATMRRRRGALRSSEVRKQLGEAGNSPEH